METNLSSYIFIIIEMLMQQMIEVSVKEVDYFFIWLKEVYLIVSMLEFYFGFYWV